MFPPFGIKPLAIAAWITVLAPRIAVAPTRDDGPSRPGDLAIPSESQREVTRDRTVSAAIDSLERSGRFGEAAALATSDLHEIRERRASPSRLVSGWMRLGKLHLEQGAYPQAMSAATAALDLCRRDPTVSRLDRSEALSLLARAEKDKGLYALSEMHYEQALGIARGEGPLGRDALAQALTGKANLIRRRREDRPRSLELLEEALQLRYESGRARRTEVAEVHMDLALVLMQLGRLDRAESHLRQALPAMLSLKGADHPDIGLLYSLLGWDQYLRRRYPEAELSFRRAMSTYERARGHADAGENRRRYVQGVAANLAGALLAQGKNEEAWRVLEQGLSSYLVERLEDPRGVDAATDPAASEDPRNRVQAELDPRTALVGWVEVRLVNEVPTDVWGFVLRHRGPVRWARLMTLRPGTADAAAPPRVSTLWSELQRDSAWPARVTSVDRVQSAGRAAWEERFAPLEGFLGGIDRLVVVNASAAAGPPIESFVDSEGRALLERFEVSYVPSARVFLALRARAQKCAIHRGKVLLVGDPGPSSAAEANQTPLLWSQLEVRRIASLFPGSVVLMGQSARETTLHGFAASGLLSRCSLLHFATHAARNPGLPEFGALLLEGGEGVTGSVRGSREVRAGRAAPDADANPALHGDDGLLTAAEIEAWKLQGPMVVLSGCQTSGFQFFGVAPGLVESFLVAGAGSMVVSLWNVDDRSTSLLMTRFYENLVRERRTPMGSHPQLEDPGSALREAKLWLMSWVDPGGHRPFRNPAYWAGFVLIGSAGSRDRSFSLLDRGLDSLSTSGTGGGPLAGPGDQWTPGASEAGSPAREGSMLRRIERTPVVRRRPGE